MSQVEIEPPLHADAEMRREIRALKAALSRVTAERDKLRRASEQLKEQLELLRRRIYVAKAERVDATQQLEIEFSDKLAELRRLASVLEPDAPPEAGAGTESETESPAPERKKPKGRRDLSAASMPEERVEILDPSLEGKAERIGFEESSRLAYRRGGPVRIVVARAKYKTHDGQTTTVVTAEKPRELFRRGLLAPSLVAHILVACFARWPTSRASTGGFRPFAS